MAALFTSWSEERGGRTRRGKRERSGSFSELFRRLFVDRAPRTDGDDPDDLLGSINAVDNAEPPHSVLPVALQFPLKGFAVGRIGAKSSNSLPDAAFQIRMEMTDDFGHPWRDGRPEQGHYRLRFFTGRSGSPNTSSNDNPLPPFAKYRALSRICRIIAGSLRTSSVSFNRSYSA